MWNRTDLLWFRFRFWKNFSSGSGSAPVPDPVSAPVPFPDPKNILHSFSASKFVQTLAFSLFSTSEAPLFPRTWASQF
jgi:hypothetical protein